MSNFYRRNKGVLLFIIKLLLLILSIEIFDNRDLPIHYRFKMTFLYHYYEILMVYSAKGILYVFGYQIFIYDGVKGLILYHDADIGVKIGYGCSAISLFLYYSAFIVAYPGRIRHKIWYIPLGVFAIFLINELRIVGILIIRDFYPDYVDINHKFIFKTVVYFVIFLFWVGWIKYYGDSFKKKKKQNKYEKINRKGLE